MKINQSMTISDLQEMFEKDFDAKLIINTNIKSLRTELYEIAKIKDRHVTISVNESSRTRSIEKMFMQQFGINVEICDRWGNSVAKDIMLSEVNEEAKKKNQYQDESSQNIENEESENGNAKIVALKKDVHSYVGKEEVKKEDPRIKNIKNAYMKYQKTEKYSDMKKLISLLEEAQVFAGESSLSGVDYELKKTISNIKTYGKNVASMHIKKKKFFISILATIVIITSLAGAFVSVLERLNEKQISNDIDNIIRSSQSKRDASGYIDTELLTEKQKQLDAIRSRGIKKDALLIVGIIGLLITSIFVVNLNKYTVTSYRFD